MVPAMPDFGAMMPIRTGTFCAIAGKLMQRLRCDGRAGAADGLQ